MDIADTGKKRYHWALLIGPKHEDSDSTGKRFHVKETMTAIDGRTQSRWVFEERDISMNPTAMILVRVVIGKVASAERAAAVLRGVPVRDNQSGWNCVWWLREALDMLRADGKALGSRSLSSVAWEQAGEAAMDFVRRKEREHRFDGRAAPGWFDMNRVATYDLLQGEEIVA